jgi:hypothetical protein
VTPVRTWSFADDQTAFSLDQRRMAHLNALDVGDRIEGAGPSADERTDAELARPRRHGALPGGKFDRADKYHANQDGERSAHREHDG